MNKIKITLLLSTLLLAAHVRAATFTVDPDHTNVGFTVKHLLSQVSGHFSKFTGEFEFDEKKPEAAKGSFKVETASVDTGIVKRDNHLKSEDFFDAAKNPELTFVVKKVSKGKGKNKFKMDGDLTMRGVTKPVSFDLEYNGQVEFYGKMRAGFVANAEINRKDFGINWNKALDHGGFVLGETVKIQLQVEAVGPDAKPEAKAEAKAPAKK